MTEPTPHVLKRIAAGDSTAVGECLNAYGGLVWSLCKKMCQSLDDAEDVVQEIFIELWKSADRYDPTKASESTFIAMIARRRLIDRIRSRTRAVPSETIDENAIGTENEAIGRKMELADDAKQAQECLGKLKTDEQSVIELAVCEGDSHSTVSEKLGLPLGTVKSHARRGLVKLRDCMKAHAFGMSGGDA